MTMTAELAIDEQLQNSALELAAASDIQVDSPESFEYAGEMILDIDAAINKRVEHFADMKKITHQAWKKVCENENNSTEPLKQARALIKSRMSAYATEQDRIRRQAEARAQEEARRKEEEERQRLQESAAEARAEGQEEVAELLEAQSQNAVVIPEVVEPVIAKTAKVSGGSVTQAKALEISVENLRDFLTAALADPTLPLDSIVKVDVPKLKAWAKLHGTKTFTGLSIREVINPTFKRN